MLFKTLSSLQLMLLLLFACQQRTAEANASSLSQLKSAQQSQQQPQLHSNVHQPAATQQQHQHVQHHQQQQQPPPPPPSPSSLPLQSQSQYVHDKDDMQDVIKSINTEEELNYPYQMLNELKHEPRLPTAHYPWNPYASQQRHAAYPYDGFPAWSTPKFLPFFGFPQPFFIPFSLFVPPEMLYSAFPPATNDIEDTMSRTANARRPLAASTNNAYPRNSPIHYLRVPPTPYMFLPGLGYSSSAAVNSFPPMLPYQSYPTFSALSSIFNLPTNFLANGKPSNIYQMSGSPNDIQNPFQFGSVNTFDTHHAPINPYKPTASTGFSQSSSSYGLSTLSPPQQDSKMTSLKRPFLFNGRLEDVYILPNNFNALYPEAGYY